MPAPSRVVEDARPDRFGHLKEGILNRAKRRESTIQVVVQVGHYNMCSSEAMPRTQCSAPVSSILARTSLPSRQREAVLMISLDMERTSRA